MKVISTLVLVLVLVPALVLSVILVLSTILGLAQSASPISAETVINDYKMVNGALEGQMRKAADIYLFQERELLKEIEWLNKYIRWSELLPITPPNQIGPGGLIEAILPNWPFEDATPPYMETDDGQHNQSETWPRVAYPESPDRLSEDTWMGCGGDARERFSKRHSRLVSLQKRVWRKMGRR